MNRITAILLFCFSAVTYAQSRSSIDAINNTSFETKTEQSATIDTLFLKNARDAKKIKYAKGEADSYVNLGLVYYYQGKYNLNVGYVLKAIKIYESIGARDKQAGAYGELGYSMKRRNMQKAQYYMQKGKSIAETDSLMTALMSIYNNYGVLKEMQQDLDSALYFYKKGLALKENIKDSLGIPHSLNNIGGIYVMKGNYAEAKKLYDQALKIRVLKNDQIGIAENNTCLGDLYYMKKDYRKGVEYYKKSLEIAQEYKYTYWIQVNYKSLSDCYDSLHNSTEAYKNFKKYSQYKDSIVNTETNSKIAELEIQFETNKKEKLLLQKESEVKQRNILLMAVSLLSVFIAFIGFLIYRQQKLKHTQLEQEHELKTAISQIETQNKLQNQRLQISRDLHDNIGAQLTFIISSVDNIKYAFDLKNTKLDTKLNSISTFTRETIVELRDTIWAMNHSEINFEDLRARILNFVEKAKEVKENIRFDFKIDDELNAVKLTSIEGMNIYRTIQEALNNALKYANPTAVSIDIKKSGNAITIDIKDNGNGFDEEQVELGNGILNMQNRISAIGAQFGIKSTPGIGTEIHIVFDKLTI
ncbi:MAG TPA: sensor histidine kinase [Flavobacterium sp.]|nr:sensor histidine kinase [Flavobacterium sp.]